MWCSAVGTEMMDSISADASTSSTTRGRAGCLCGRVFRLCLHSSLLLTLVGILQRIICYQGRGRKENKKHISSRGQTVEFRHPCPRFTATALMGPGRSWVSKSHVTPAGLWNPSSQVLGVDKNLLRRGFFSERGGGIPEALPLSNRFSFNPSGSFSAYPCVFQTLSFPPFIQKES